VSVAKRRHSAARAGHASPTSADVTWPVMQRHVARHAASCGSQATGVNTSAGESLVLAEVDGKSKAGPLRLSIQSRRHIAPRIRPRHLQGP
jgi:hypothetical protein